MSFFGIRAKTVSRSTGRTASGAAAYRAGENLTDHEGNSHDYSRKKGIVQVGIVTPTNSPNWANCRNSLWQEADKSETRKNSTVAREYEFALSKDLSIAEQKELVCQFGNFLKQNYGVAVDMSIHLPRNGNNNYHAHILTSTRVLTINGFEQKTRILDDIKTGPEEIRKIRKVLADLTNEALIEAEKTKGLEPGSFGRVDHRTLTEQGIDREPTIHEGNNRYRKAENQAIKERNAERTEIDRKLEALEAKRRELDKAIEQPTPAPITEEQPAATPLPAAGRQPKTQAATAPTPKPGFLERLGEFVGGLVGRDFGDQPRSDPHEVERKELARIQETHEKPEQAPAVTGPQYAILEIQGTKFISEIKKSTDTITFVHEGKKFNVRNDKIDRITELTPEQFQLEQEARARKQAAAQTKPNREQPPKEQQRQPADRSRAKPKDLGR